MSVYFLSLDVVCLQLEEIPIDFFLEISPQKNVIYLIFQVLIYNISLYPHSPLIERNLNLIKDGIIKNLLYLILITKLAHDIKTF